MSGKNEQQLRPAQLARPVQSCSPPHHAWELALGQIHNWQMHTSTRSQQGDRDGCMSRIMDRLDDLRELNQLHVVRLDRYATDINQKVGGIQSSVSALEQKLNGVKDEQKMIGKTY